MENKTYGLVAGIALLVVAVVFLVLPGLLDYDAFRPVHLCSGGLHQWHRNPAFRPGARS